MTKYWLSSIVVTVIITAIVFAMTEHFWLCPILLGAFYGGVGFYTHREEA